MSELAGSGVLVFRTSKLGSVVLAGSIVTVLLEFCASTTAFVQELGGLLDREANLAW
jgi:hypothetical protein